MKKLIAIIAILALATVAFATESDPSETVGFVKYSCLTTTGTNWNFLALPMESGYTTAGELGDAIGDCDAVAKWDATTQGWIQASYVPPMGWMGDFDLVDGNAYMVSVTADVDVFIAGDLLPDPTFDLITTTGTNWNFIMLPLSSDLITAGALGDDIGVCDAVAKWDAPTQGWIQASYVPPMGWMGSFAIDIAQPLMVSVTADVTWPSSDSMTKEKPVSVKKHINETEHINNDKEIR